MTRPGAPYGPAYGFGLYIHWPYCARICPYCDFNVYAAKTRDPDPLAEAIVADIHAHRAWLGEGYFAGGLTSIYFGGGTPSLLPPSWIEAMVQAAKQAFGLAPECEITLEANPNDILGADLAAWRTAGINRLSIGVQSLDDTALLFLGRDHTSDDARRAVTAGLAQFSNTSIDLIYARPAQSATEWEQELKDALALGAPHLSLYELTIEEKTAFGKAVSRGEWSPMEDDDQADLYELTQAICAAEGLPAYEVSNHARSPTCQSRHNLTYWRGGDWIGVGPGAHGRLTVQGDRIATYAHKRPADYMQALQRGGPAWVEHKTLTVLDTAREVLALGLRPTGGIARDRVEALSGPLDAARLRDFQAEGWLHQDGEHLALTPAGWLLADRIAAELSP